MIFLKNINYKSEFIDLKKLTENLLVINLTSKFLYDARF
jgi:hypothetical protein